MAQQEINNMMSAQLLLDVLSLTFSIFIKNSLCSASFTVLSVFYLCIHWWASLVVQYYLDSKEDKVRLLNTASWR